MVILYGNLSLSCTSFKLYLLISVFHFLFQFVLIFRLMFCSRSPLFSLSRRLCKRHITSFSGRLDGSVDAEATSRQHFEEIQHDSKKLLNQEQFLVSSGNEYGFRINQSFVAGPVLILPYMGFLHWQFNSIPTASAESLFLISRIFPKVCFFTILKCLNDKRIMVSFVTVLFVAKSILIFCCQIIQYF